MALCKKWISPPAWGWPGSLSVLATAGGDFPTRVGMARSRRNMHTGTRGFPHPRGDGPSGDVVSLGNFPISPPAWGWPDLLTPRSYPLKDFPTRVGMARRRPPPHPSRRRFPHPRGDGPVRAWPLPGGHPISPPAWGWPGKGHQRCGPDRDFPTRVGMARRSLSYRI